MPENPDAPPLIAIIGCDGSGKSTVSEQLLVWASGYGPAAAAHLGKQAGNVGRWLSGLPLIGNWFERLIKRKVASVNDSHKEKKTPGMFPAVVMQAFTLRRVRRFRRMLALRDQGMIIIADRFPQLEFPRAFDGPGMAVEAHGNPFVRWLAHREQSAFEWMTSYRPDLVIRLNVDLDTACARKPDHRREALEKKIEYVPRLTFNGAPIAEIDASRSLDQVLVAARAAVTRTLTERGYQRSESQGNTVSQ